MSRIVSLVALSFACSSSVDPNQGLFACETDTDCGSTYRCIAQAKGGKRCYVAAKCIFEDPCNGVDDDCDGVVDNFVREEGMACQTPLKGACSVGQIRCQVGALACVEKVMPTAEQCNGIDDDCDGDVDEDFMLSSSSSNCGMCGRVCLNGSMCELGACVEKVCDDGIDNDMNGKVDCDDQACLGRACAPNDFRCVAPDGGFDAGGADAGMTDGGTQPADGGLQQNCRAM
jgi:hypothetical protein